MADAWQKKYIWTRTWGDEPGLNNLPHEDYVGWDGHQNIGRIYLDNQTLKAGAWRWAGGMPKGCRTMGLPNSGWLPTASDAARRVEDYWDAMLQTQKRPPPL